ncbi:MAG: hypothetical protein ACI83I_000853 [Bacteroidia bacterium]|jgi:hypothetical protein
MQGLYEFVLQYGISVMGLLLVVGLIASAIVLKKKWVKLSALYLASFLIAFLLYEGYLGYKSHFGLNPENSIFTGDYADNEYINFDSILGYTGPERGAFSCKKNTQRPIAL